MNIETIKTRYGVVGHNPRLNSALEVAVQVAPTEVSVLIQGENGTGKDVFSKIIHQNSKRKHQNFMAINTGAIPEGTMDSELFGHEKGAFTGAVESRKGYFEEVESGTIFLDEIGEMPMATQARLLRLLENQEYLRVGSSKIRKSNVRVIAATNKNLFEQIRKGKFREDLYFRLNTITIQVPPLRERGQDIELLFYYFANEFAHELRRNPISLTPDATDLLFQYRWPGNVRELRNFVQKLNVLVKEDIITSSILNEHLHIRDSYLPSLVPSLNNDAPSANDTKREIDLLYKMVFKLKEEVSTLKDLVMGIPPNSFPEEYRQLPRSFETGEQEYQTENPNARKFLVMEPQAKFYGSPVEADPQPAPIPLLEESLSLEKKEKEMIIRALNKYHNNRKKAAQELGISERTLYRKLKTYNLS